MLTCIKGADFRFDQPQGQEKGDTLKAIPRNNITITLVALLMFALAAASPVLASGLGGGIVLARFHHAVAAGHRHPSAPAQYLIPVSGQPPIPNALPGYVAPPRAPALRPRPYLPPRLRSLRRPRPAATSSAQPRVTPSEALRLAQQRWPRSIPLSVRLLRRSPPVYAVKLKAGSRVVKVMVDARTGRVWR